MMSVCKKAPKKVAPDNYKDVPFIDAIESVYQKDYINIQVATICKLMGLELYESVITSELYLTYTNKHDTTMYYDLYQVQHKVHEWLLVNDFKPTLYSDIESILYDCSLCEVDKVSDTSYTIRYYKSGYDSVIDISGTEQDIQMCVDGVLGTLVKLQ